MCKYTPCLQQLLSNDVWKSLPIMCIEHFSLPCTFHFVRINTKRDDNFDFAPWLVVRGQQFLVCSRSRPCSGIVHNEQRTTDY